MYQDFLELIDFLERRNAGLQICRKRNSPQN